jgi:uncharacterized membrane protein YqhA
MAAMGKLRQTLRRFRVMNELATFLWRERLWWMIPVALALVLAGVLLFVGASPAVAPFVYTLF